MAQATLSCPFGAIHLERRRGPPSMSADPQRALIGGLSPDPCYGSVSLWVFGKFRRAKSRSVSLLLPGLRALLPSKYVTGYFYHTPPGAYLPVECGGSRMDPLPRLCQTRRCHLSRISSKFLPCRPQWAEVSGITELVFARREGTKIFQEGVPRNWGVRGQAA